MPIQFASDVRCGVARFSEVGRGVAVGSLVRTFDRLSSSVFSDLTPEELCSDPPRFRKELAARPAGGADAPSKIARAGRSMTTALGREPTAEELADVEQAESLLRARREDPDQ